MSPATTPCLTRLPLPPGSFALLLDFDATTIQDTTSKKTCKTCITAQGDISPYIVVERVAHHFTPNIYVGHLGGNGSTINEKIAFFNCLAPSLPTVIRDKFLYLTSVSAPLESKGVSD